MPLFICGQNATSLALPFDFLIAWFSLCIYSNIFLLITVGTMLCLPFKGTSEISWKLIFTEWTCIWEVLILLLLYLSFVSLLVTFHRWLFLSPLHPRCLEIQHVALFHVHKYASACSRSSHWQMEHMLLRMCLPLLSDVHVGTPGSHYISVFLKSSVCILGGAFPVPFVCMAISGLWSVSVLKLWPWRK